MVNSILYPSRQLCLVLGVPVPGRHKTVVWREEPPSVVTVSGYKIDVVSSQRRGVEIGAGRAVGVRTPYDHQRVVLVARAVLAVQYPEVGDDC